MVDYRRREPDKIRKREINFIKGKKDPVLEEFDNNDTINVSNDTINEFLSKF